MAKTNKELLERIERLEKENQQLKATCDETQQTQIAYEQIIGENNLNFLRSDMARMELEQIFSAYTDAMWVIREDGCVVRANKAMQELLNKPDEELIGQPCSTFFCDDLCDTELCPLKTPDSKSTREFDIQLQFNQDEERHYLVTVAPLMTLNGSPGVATQFKDITSRKKAEKELAEANRKLQVMARIDGLTQIANRRTFDETLKTEWTRLRRAQKPLSLLLADIDFFKKFNDFYGHQAGDDCLQQVAKALAESVQRPADLAARYGGEEFVVLLPEIDIDGALAVGKKIFAAIETLQLPHQASEVAQHVTLSMGAATLLPNQEQLPEELIALADTALYQAKERGRNRIVPAPQSTISIVKQKLSG